MAPQRLYVADEPRTRTVNRYMTANSTSFKKGHPQLNTGRTHFKVGQIGPWQGKKRSPETIKKMSDSLKGRVAWNKGKQLLHLRGENAGNWKGGLTPKNKLLRNSGAYAEWRRHVFQRDDYTCQACGQRGGELNADHELPLSQFPTLCFEILNGRTLCVPCHRKTPTFASKSLSFQV